ncbi:SDR family oxidoreductase [Salirhabdus sp. Marseille-P4669]|uniref:SDR family oxidoreductase n=1 Tax=Salirhabdus sp. Marseille-P4669 TaxID=2042310 RepID=UPI000C7E00F3|nr:SDR family oxidoreductase [Salirhabdus sp. Marseille-P4669]
MGNTYFFTGYPGYLATYLIRELFDAKYPVDHIYALVLPSFMEKAQQSVQMLTDQLGISSDKISLIAGDITEERLAIQEKTYSKLMEEVTHVFHLAAIYDLAVPLEPAKKVNITGTKNVNAFVLDLKMLERYVYFSTAFVAGKRQGTVYEHDLQHNEGHNNHYEATKYEAEVLVDALKERIPTTIIRPGIVVGHSQTGETLKFDGPYFMLNMFRHIRFMPLIPYVGKANALLNVVPLDYIIQSTIYLGHMDKNQKKSATYHLTDPNPYTARELYRLFMYHYLGKKPKGTVPHKLAEFHLKIPFIRKWMQVEKQALDYFNEQTIYDCSEAQRDLKGSGIKCPDMKNVIPNLVKYYKEHATDKSKHIEIA